MRSLAFFLATIGLSISSLWAQSSLQFTNVQRITNQEILLRLAAPAGALYRLETSSNLLQWDRWMTFSGSAATQSQTDSAAPYLPLRYYRGVKPDGTNLMTGDHLLTADSDVVIHPINHASFVMSYKDKWIYNDPVGAASLYNGLGRPDLILISHAHGDHFLASTLTSIRSTNTLIYAPKVVYDSMPAALKAITSILTNGASTNLGWANIDAIGMYNLDPARQNHPKGVGNGYVLTVGGKRLYMAGDTEDIPEMRALKNIDAAFICMNLPFTMSPQQAANAVREFRPKVVYPYHFSGSDPGVFKRLVGTDLGIEVRLRRWY